MDLIDFPDEFRRAELRRRRLDAHAYPGFYADLEYWTEAGLLEFVGNGQDERRVTDAGICAAFAMLALVREAALAVARVDGLELAGGYDDALDALWNLRQLALKAKR